MRMKHGKKTVRMKMAAKTSVQTAAKTAAQRAAAKTAARLAAKLCVLLLAAALAFPETAFAGWLDSTFTVERLDDGLLLYVYSEEKPGLKEAEEGKVYSLSEPRKRIYFYMGEAPGYKLSAVYGEETQDYHIDDLTEHTKEPGAQEAYELGCRKWMYFTHWHGVPDRSREIYVCGEIRKYQVEYETEGAQAPADDRLYSLAEGENVITLAEAPAREGWLFGGWQLGEDRILQAGETLELDEETLALADEGAFRFRALWEAAASYTVDYYLESETGTYPQEPGLSVRHDGVKAGSEVSAELEPEGLDTAGYALDSRHHGSLLSGVVSADGALRLRVFYGLDGDGSGVPDRYERPDEPGGDEPGGGDEPDGGDEPGGGDEPDGGEEPGGGDEPGGTEEPGSSGDKPGGGSQPGGESGSEAAAAEPELPLPEEEELEELLELSEEGSGGAGGDGSDDRRAGAAVGYRLLEVASARGSRTEGGAEEEADSLDSEEAEDAGQAGAAAAEAETIDDEPAPLGERRVAVEGLPVIWLAALAVLAAGLLLILLWRRKEKERKRRLADEMAAQAAADFLDREQR